MYYVIYSEIGEQLLIACDWRPMYELSTPARKTINPQHRNEEEEGGEVSLRGWRHASVTHGGSLLRKFALPERLAILSPLVSNQPNHDQRDDRDTCKDAEPDGQHGQVLAWNLEGA